MALYLLLAGLAFLTLAGYLHLLELKNENGAQIMTEEIAGALSQVQKEKEELKQLSKHVQDLGDHVVQNLDDKIKKVKETIAEVETQIQTSQQQNEIQQETKVIKKIVNKSVNKAKLEPIKLKKEQQSLKDGTTGNVVQITDPRVNKYQKVFALAEKGMEVSEIARSLGMGQGEVKLLLDLKVRGGH